MLYDGMRYHTIAVYAIQYQVVLYRKISYHVMLQYTVSQQIILHYKSHTHNTIPQYIILMQYDIISYRIQDLRPRIPTQLLWVA